MLHPICQISEEVFQNRLIVICVVIFLIIIIFLNTYYQKQRKKFRQKIKAQKSVFLIYTKDPKINFPLSRVITCLRQVNLDVINLKGGYIYCDKKVEDAKDILKFQIKIEHNAIYQTYTNKFGQIVNAARGAWVSGTIKFYFDVKNISETITFFGRIDPPDIIYDSQSFSQCHFKAPVKEAFNRSDFLEKLDKIFNRIYEQKN